VLTGPAGADLKALWSILRRELIVEGFGKELEHSFVPHVTWIYSRDSHPEQAIEPIVWTAREFRAGAQHRAQPGLPDSGALVADARSA
jgi:2'-5' RNA ligase